MRKSLLKQLILTAVLGPFGLFYTSATAALAIVFAALLAVYSSTDPLSIGYLVIALPTVLAVSSVIGIVLVEKHNRHWQRTFSFQLIMAA